MRVGGLPISGISTLRKGLPEKAKERGQKGEGAKLLSPSFFSRGVLIRMVIMCILSCIHCGDRGGHVPSVVQSKKRKTSALGG